MPVRSFGTHTRLGFDVEVARGPPESVARRDYDFPATARVSIWVKGKNLAATTSEAGPLLDAFDWGISPILEWFARNWIPILYEESLPGPSRGLDAASAIIRLRELAAEDSDIDAGIRRSSAIHSWWLRHSIQSARDGGVIPNILFRRLGDDLEVSWDESQAVPGTERQFVERRGFALFPIVDAVGTVGAFLRDTAFRVLTLAADRADIPTEFREIVDKTSEIPSLSDAIPWMAGVRARLELTDQAPGVEVGRAEEDLIASAPPSHEGGVYLQTAPTLLFSSISPRITSADVEGIRGVLSEAEEEPEFGSELHRHAHRVEPEPWTPPWRQGESLAAAVRAELEIGVRETFDSAQVFDSLGIRRTTVGLSDPEIRAITVTLPGHSPIVAINSGSRFFTAAHAVEMDYAHELCHVLFDQPYGKPLGVASGPWAPRYVEQRANSFAANLRLPRDALRELPHGVDAIAKFQREFNRLMERFGVGRTVATWQLYHAGLISPDERIRLLGEVGSSDYWDPDFSSI